MKRFLLAPAVAIAFLGVMITLPVRAQGQPGLVAPETLSQGFILVVQDGSGLAGSKDLFLGGNLNNWNPADPAMKLQPRSDQRWQIILPKQSGPMDFKITRGSWDTVEVSADLSDRGNRRLSPIDATKLKPGEQPVFELTIEKWADQRPGAQARKAVDAYHALKVTGDVRRLQVPGGGGTAIVRDLLVWLPPGYNDPANAARTYPVLYLQDGQNLFEQLPGVPGEWHADETATDLIAKGKIEPLIIVGIPSSGPFRVTEYATQRGLNNTDPRGDEYVQWLIERVIPRVQATFRVKPGPANTAIGGSSLGALVALHAATRHPEIFGKVLAESPTLVIADRQILMEEFGSVQKWPLRMSLAMGGHEVSTDPRNDAKNLEHIHAMKNLSVELHKVMPAEALRVDLDMQGEHNENTWARRLPADLIFLFPAAEKQP